MTDPVAHPQRATPSSPLRAAGGDGWLPPHQPNCLGCGDRNPGSMGVRLRVEGERIIGEVTLDERHEGAPGFAHGGAVATVLDDTLGSALLMLKQPAVTGKLEITYRKPAFLGRRFDLAAWIERVDGRKVFLAGEMREQGELIAEAKGVFIVVELEHFMQGAGEPPEHWQERAERGELELPW